MNRREAKPCTVCGRQIEPRRKWRGVFEEVKYCSVRCRRRGLRPVDRQLESAILELLGQAQGGTSICPNEAARQIQPDAWSELREPSRAAARRLVARGQAQIVQRGRIVDPSSARGPIRVRLVR